MRLYCMLNSTTDCIENFKYAKAGVFNTRPGKGISQNTMRYEY